jgi:hypothetical protein
MILGYSDVCEGVGSNKYWVSWPKMLVKSTIDSDRIAKHDMNLIQKWWWWCIHTLTPRRSDMQDTPI